MSEQESSVMVGKRFSYVDQLNCLAPKQDVESNLSKLLALYGVVDPQLLKELTSFPVTLGNLRRISDFNRLLTDEERRDDLGRAWLAFAGADLLLLTVITPHLLNQNIALPAGLSRIMELAAEGLLELGLPQFKILVETMNDLVAWIRAKRPSSVALIESPLGNSLPIQLLQDLLKNEHISVDIVIWNAPRNDRSSIGRTVEEAAQLCADETVHHELVLFIDDVLTGTRFIKLFDALKVRVNGNHFVSVALVFADPKRPALEHHANRKRCRARLERHCRKSGYSKVWAEFPQLPKFQVDSLSPQIWQDPMIWGTFDIIAGKRKVNLIFTLVEHFIKILKDLGSETSIYMPYLSRARGWNVNGPEDRPALARLTTEFKEAWSLLDRHGFEQKLHGLARDSFPLDYAGAVSSIEQVDSNVQLKWIMENFITEAQIHIGEVTATCILRAILDVFTSSFPEMNPEPSRDASAAQYVLPFNPSIQVFNQHLRKKLVEMAKAE